MEQVIPNSKDLKVTNLEHLARGTGAKYLEVQFDSRHDCFIARRWRRNLNAPTPAGCQVIAF